MPVSMEGHRERMRMRAERMATDGIRSQDLMEMFLYYSLPRRDTRELAGMLMKEFATLDDVLCAGRKRLDNVAGLGPRSAQWLSALGELVDAYRSMDDLDRPRVYTFERMRVLLKRFFRHDDYPCVKQFMLTGGFRLLGVIDMAPCGAWGEPRYMSEAMNTAIEFGAHSVLIAQYSDVPYLEADEYDVRSTEDYGKVLTAADIKLMDHVVISPGHEYSMFQSGLMGWTEKKDRESSEYRRYMLAEPDFDGDLYK